VRVHHPSTVLISSTDRERRAGARRLKDSAAALQEGRPSGRAAGVHA